MLKNESQEAKRQSTKSSNSAIIFAGYALLIYTFGAIAYVVPLLVGSTRRGFFCKDVSISYPYHSNTIEYWVVITTCYALTVLIITFIEFYLTRHQPKFMTSNFTYTIFGREVSPSVIDAVKFFLVSQAGWMVTTWFYNLCKYSVGRLRPHFLDVCQPNVTDCQSHTYVEDYVCLGTDTKKLKDARLSFFSGHCATSFYYATFLIVYSYLRLVAHRPRWIPAFVVVSVLLLSSATFVGVSRIFDNKHHPDDVLVGALEGILVACATVFCFRHMFTEGTTRTANDGCTSRSKSLSEVSMSSDTADSSA